MIFSHFSRACCLLAACLLAKPVRSTLDTKEGYNTKTSSTSSVTRPLPLPVTLPLPLPVTLPIPLPLRLGEPAWPSRHVTPPLAPRPRLPLDPPPPLDPSAPPGSPPSPIAPPSPGASGRQLVCGGGGGGGWCPKPRGWPPGASIHPSIHPQKGTEILVIPFWFFEHKRKGLQTCVVEVFGLSEFNSSRVSFVLSLDLLLMKFHFLYFPRSYCNNCQFFFRLHNQFLCKLCKDIFLLWGSVGANGYINQYSYITPAFSGSPWWGEINMATSPLPSWGPHCGEKLIWLHNPRKKCGLGLRIKSGLKRCSASNLVLPRRHGLGSHFKIVY